MRNDKLRYPHSATDTKSFLTVVDQDHLDLPSIVGVDGARAVQNGDAVLEGQARSRSHLAFGSCGKGEGDTGRHGAPLSRGNGEWLFDRRQQIQASGVRRGSLGQGKVLRVGQAVDRDLQQAHRIPAHGVVTGGRNRIMRSTNRSAAACLLSLGHASVSVSSISVISLLSPPKVPLSALTSLARIQSQPFRRRLAPACSTTSSVSAAKPITRAGRCSSACERWARMSGFSSSLSSGCSPDFFLSFWGALRDTLQSA